MKTAINCENLFIHACNIHGLGAGIITKSLLQAFDGLASEDLKIKAFIPESGYVSEFMPTSKEFSICKTRKKKFNSIYRFFDCVVPRIKIPKNGHLIVLGDVPLRTSCFQTLFLQQRHLVSPKQDCFSCRSSKCRIMRALTRINSKFSDRVIVQTDAMATSIGKTYPLWKQRGCIEVVGQPVPGSMPRPVSPNKQEFRGNGLKLFYPSAFHPYKNHEIFEKLNRENLLGLVREVVVTTSDSIFNKKPAWIRCVGKLSHQQCLDYYCEFDGLFFPSKIESYGIPLIEAMMADLPIIVSDRPYSRTLCGEQAFYFDPRNAKSALRAIEHANLLIKSGWRPLWKKQLDQLPRNWEEVAMKFLGWNQSII